MSCAHSGRASVSERLARRIAALRVEQSKLYDMQVELGPHHLVEAAQHLEFAAAELHELRRLLAEDT